MLGGSLLSPGTVNVPSRSQSRAGNLARVCGGAGLCAEFEQRFFSGATASRVGWGDSLGRDRGLRKGGLCGNWPDRHGERLLHRDAPGSAVESWVAGGMCQGLLLQIEGEETRKGRMRG